jgi:hypothetical protein
MHSVPFPFFSAYLFILPVIAIQLAWHIAVIVLVYKIWQKVKRLPG